MGSLAVESPPGGGGEYSHTLPIRVYGVVILKPPILNGVSISEAFSRTGYNISNARKLQFWKQPLEIIQGQIAFQNTVQCVNKQTVVLLLHFPDLLDLQSAIIKLSNH